MDIQNQEKNLQIQSQERNIQNRAKNIQSPERNIQNQEKTLRDYWLILLKRRRLAFATFLSIIIPILIYTFMATPLYEAQAVILVDLEKNQSLNFSEGAALIQVKDLSEYVNTQKEIVRNRAFADRVVRKMMLHENPYFLKVKAKRNNNVLGLLMKKIRGLFPERQVSPATNFFPDLKFTDEIDPFLTDYLIKKIELRGSKNNLMKLTFRSDSPEVAAVMANGVAATYIEHNLDIRVKPFKDAADWLTARLEDSRAKVGDTEKQLQQYREGKGIVSFESKENILNQKLQELVTQLVQTEYKRQEAELKYNLIKAVIDKPEQLATVPDVMNNLVIQSLRTEELSLKRQISELSEKFGPKHPQLLKITYQLEAVQKNIIAEARKLLNSAKSEYELARSREVSLRSAVEQQKKSVMELTRTAIDFNVIAGQAVSNKQFYDLLLKKLQEASLSGGISVSNVQIVDYAVPPGSPIAPKPGLNIVVGIIIAMFGAFGAALFTEYMDDTLKTAEDVDSNLALAMLAEVPLAYGHEGSIFMMDASHSGIAEAIRTIRTGLMLASFGRRATDESKLKVILLTSSVPNEGKTTITANLAVAMAQMGEKVLVVDFDMRRHNLHEMFDLKTENGLSDVVLDPSLFSAYIKRVPDYPNLEILTGGTLVPNPSELLGSERMKELITQFRGQYDRIILDSPPAQAFSDALILSRMADGVVLVVWGGNTARDLIKNTAESLRGVGARMLGVVLNKVDLTKKAYGYYNYDTYYKQPKKISRKALKKKELKKKELDNKEV